MIAAKNGRVLKSSKMASLLDGVKSVLIKMPIVVVDLSYLLSEEQITVATNQSLSLFISSSSFVFSCCAFIIVDSLVRQPMCSAAEYPMFSTTTDWTSV